VKLKMEFPGVNVQPFVQKILNLFVVQTTKPTKMNVLWNLILVNNKGKSILNTWVFVVSFNFIFQSLFTIFFLLN